MLDWFTVSKFIDLDSFQYYRKKIVLNIKLLVGTDSVTDFSRCSRNG